MKNFYYRVREKDSLKSIAKEFKTSEMLIIKENKLFNDIRVGDVLKICIPKHIYTVKISDDLYSVSEKLGVSVQQLMLDNNIEYIFYGLTLFSD